MSALQYQCNYKKISRMMSSLHRIWKDKRLSSTPNQITSLSSTGLAWPPTWCLWQMLHIRWHQNVTNAYFVTHQYGFFQGCSGAGKQGRAASPTFSEKVCIINVTNASVQFWFQDRVRHFVLDYTSAFFCRQTHTKPPQPAVKTTSSSYSSLYSSLIN